MNEFKRYEAMILGIIQNYLEDIGASSIFEVICHDSLNNITLDIKDINEGDTMEFVVNDNI